MSAWLRIPLQFATVGLGGFVAAVAVVTGAYYYVEPTLPRADELRDVPYQTPLSVYSRDGRLMQQYGEQLRTPVSFEDIPDRLWQAVVAAEDDRFFEHSGIDYLSTARAIFNYVTHPGERVPGGSTITQQITRTTNLLPRDYRVGRKISEIFLAYRIEHEFTKKEILELYLNTYFFGQRSYGVVSAARTYFNKDVGELTLSEAAIIAGIPRAPSRNNPYNSPPNAERRRAYVLRRMYELGYIDDTQRQAALNEPIVSRKYDLDLELDADYVAQMAYEWCQRKFDKATCDTAGLKITTTVDSRLQRAANKALRDDLEDYDRRHGYRGPIGHIDLGALGLADDAAPVDAAADSEDQDDVRNVPGSARPTSALDTLLGDYPNEFGTESAVVLDVNDASADVYLRSRGLVSIGFDAVSWARPYVTDNTQGAYPSVVGDVLMPGDIIRLRPGEAGALELVQIPGPMNIQGALVSLDPMDGAIVALIGGYSFNQTEYNRATQTKRQPGSSFKPFFYLSALAHGYTLASIVKDVALSEYSDTLERRRYVENYDGIYHGEVSLRFALKHSLNAAADRVVRDIGASYARDYLKRFGFSDTALPSNASLALGSGGVAPLELAAAYAKLANGGFAVGIRPDQTSQPEPYFVQRVEDADGNLLYDASDSVEMVCPEPDPDEDSAEDRGKGLITEKSELFPWPLRCAERVESAQRVYLITDVLKEVVTETSGVRAGRAFPERTDLAGKTGTTNGPRDAWFAGFNADILAVAWIGFNLDTRDLGNGEQGGRTAIPAWIDFMKVALDGQPEHELSRPPGIIDLLINPKTGLIAADCNRDVVSEKFEIANQPGREPESVCFRGVPQPAGPESPRRSSRVFD